MVKRLFLHWFATSQRPLCGAESLGNVRGVGCRGTGRGPRTGAPAIRGADHCRALMQDVGITATYDERQGVAAETGPGRRDCYSTLAGARLAGWRLRRGDSQAVDGVARRARQAVSNSGVACSLSW